MFKSTSEWLLLKILTIWYCQSNASLKKYAHKKSTFYKEKDVTDKVKCFEENDKRKVLGLLKLLFWFAKDQKWVEIK